MKTFLKASNNTDRKEFYDNGCLVIIRDGYRKVYPLNSPFSCRQQPHKLESLSNILLDATSVLAVSCRNKLSTGDKI